MSAESARELSPSERAVLLATLERAPRCDDPAKYIREIHSLRVVGHCPCGCGSIEFACLDPGRDEGLSIVADGLGKTERGGNVGVIVRATGSHLIGMEIYDMGAGDEDKNLPMATSITSFDLASSAADAERSNNLARHEK